MRVAIAEDSLVYRAGLVRLLEAAGSEVVGEVGTGDEMLSLLEASDLPDVVILDIAMGRRKDDGLRTALTIRERHPSVGLLLLSAFAETSYAERLFEDGSAGKGYMLKDNLNNISDLNEALSRVHRGQTYSDHHVVDMLMRRSRGRSLQDLLSPREQRILVMLANGSSNAAIADALGTTVGTVEASVSGVYTKMGINQTPEYNRRVLAVLRWLAEQDRHQPLGPR